MKMYTFAETIVNDWKQSKAGPSDAETRQADGILHRAVWKGG